MKRREMPEKLIDDTKNLVVLMLLSSRDCYVNQKIEVHRFDVNEGYYAEAFGILRGLKLCGYGYFGASNTPREISNLKWWFGELEDEALLEEENLGLQNAIKKYKELVYNSYD